MTHPFNRSYFDGESMIGYHPPGYGNFASNYTVADAILSLNPHPQSVLELGGCRGYISRLLENHGIYSVCLDIAKFCFYTRACKKFIVADATEKLPFQDKQIDLCFSKDFLEHISEDKIDNVIKEIVRISKRSLHLVTFSSHPNANDDKTHQCIKDKKWWLDKFDKITKDTDYVYTIEDKEKYEYADINIIKKFHPSMTSTSMTSEINLNVGSYTVMIYGWINIDKLDLSGFAKHNGYEFKQIDIEKDGLKEYKNGTVNHIVASHFLEHLSREEGLSFLRECHRVLKPGGILRVSVPDTMNLALAYTHGTIKECKEFNIGVEKSKDDAQSLWEMLVPGHKTIYDSISLNRTLEEAGFDNKNIKQVNFLESQNPIIEKEVIDQYPSITIYLEATKEQNLQMREQIATINDIPVSTNTRLTPITGPTIKYGFDSTDSITNVLSVKDKLKIAIISTPFFGCPPPNYGGLEQVVYDLAIGLDELGHEVTLFAPEGSQTPPHGHLITTGIASDTVSVDWFREEEKRFNVYKDLISPEKYHVIIDSTWFGWPYILKQKYPNLKIIHVHHGGYNWDSAPPISKPNLVAISQYMQKYTIQYFKQKGFNVGCEFVRHGVDIYKYPFQQNKSDRLLFVGRLSTFKQPHLAIEVARKTNHKLDIVGGSKFVDSPDYVKNIEKSIEGDPNISLYKDVSHQLKIEKMQNSKALLFPSKMGEPAGLVALEAMACGTPVIALDDGAIREYVIDKKTGFICQNDQEMIAAIGNIDKISPIDCRKHVEENHSRLKMAKSYEALCYKIVRGEEW